MTKVLVYDCPSCAATCSVADFQLPDVIPFFKSGKLEILKNHLNKLTSDGELSKSDEIALTRAALMLGLIKKIFRLTNSYFILR